MFNEDTLYDFNSLKSVGLFYGPGYGLSLYVLWVLDRICILLLFKYSINVYIRSCWLWYSVLLYPCRFCQVFLPITENGVLKFSLYSTFAYFPFQLYCFCFMYSEALDFYCLYIFKQYIMLLSLVIFFHFKSTFIWY